MSKDTDFYSANFTNLAGANIGFNCTNKSLATYTPATWTATNNSGCTSNSQCTGANMCCNNDNATYLG